MEKEFSKLSWRTTYGNRPRGINKVYFASAPADREKYFDPVCEQLFRERNCEIACDKEPEIPWTPQMMQDELADMKMCLVAVTHRFLEKERVSPSPELYFFQKHGIGVMAILVEDCVEEKFLKLYDGIPFLDKYKWDQEPDSPGYFSELRLFYRDRLSEVEHESMWVFDRRFELEDMGCANPEDVIMAIAADSLKNLRKATRKGVEDIILMCIKHNREETVRAVTLPLKYSLQERRDRLEAKRRNALPETLNLSAVAILPDEQPYDHTRYDLRTKNIDTVGKMLDVAVTALDAVIAENRTMDNMTEIECLYFCEKYFFPG